MATATESALPATAPANQGDAAGTRLILRGIPWDLYVQLCDADEHRKVKMAYLDGTLELMAPEYVHDSISRRLGLFVNVVGEVLDIPCQGAGSTTFRRTFEEQGLRQSAGKEADQAVYFANEPAIRGRRQLDLEIDPPPDLAIEVDNASRSDRALPIYARIGVPELWIFDVETFTLRFLALQPDGTYAAIEQSFNLPMLTPARVLQGLAPAEGLPETRWTRQLRAWVAAGFPNETFGPNP